MSLSAILIAKDEERDLPGCLESLKGLATEIVVVVSEDTTDRTEEIARAAGAKVIRRKFDDYARQRQASLDAATGRWCLWIDPDERVDAELKGWILKILEEPPCDEQCMTCAFDVPFQVVFLGKVLRWGGLGSETHLRLFLREKARFVGGALHEGIEVSGFHARIDGHIVHEPYRDISDYLSKLDRYTSLAAKKRYEAGQRFSVWRHLILPWEFFARSVLKLGVLDGYPGVVWAGLSAYHSWLKYVKLGELQRESDS